MGTPHIPAVKASPGLDAVGGSCCGAPASGVSLQNMKAMNTMNIQCGVSEYSVMTNIARPPPQNAFLEMVKLHIRQTPVL